MGDSDTKKKGISSFNKKKYRLGRERKEPVKKIIKIAFRYEIAKKKREEEKN